MTHLEIVRNILALLGSYDEWNIGEETILGFGDYNYRENIWQYNVIFDKSGNFLEMNGIFF